MSRYITAHIASSALTNTEGVPAEASKFQMGKKIYVQLPPDRWRGGEGLQGEVGGGGGLEGAEEEGAVEVAAAAEVGAAGEEEEPRGGARHGRDLISYMQLRLPTEQRRETEKKRGERRRALLGKEGGRRRRHVTGPQGRAGTRFFPCSVLGR